MYWLANFMVDDAVISGVQHCGYMKVNAFHVIHPEMKFVSSLHSPRYFIKKAGRRMWYFNGCVIICYGVDFSFTKEDHSVNFCSYAGIANVKQIDGKVRSVTHGNEGICYNIYFLDDQILYVMSNDDYDWQMGINYTLRMGRVIADRYEILDICQSVHDSFIQMIRAISDGLLN